MSETEKSDKVDGCWIIPKNLPMSNCVPGTQEYTEDLNDQCRLLEQLLFVRSKRSRWRIWLQKWKRDSWTQFLFGRILKPSLGRSFAERWISYLEDTLASSRGRWYLANVDTPPLRIFKLEISSSHINGSGVGSTLSCEKQVPPSAKCTLKGLASSVPMNTPFLQTEVSGSPQKMLRENESHSASPTPQEMTAQLIFGGLLGDILRMGGDNLAPVKEVKEESTFVAIEMKQMSSEKGLKEQGSTHIKMKSVQPHGSLSPKNGFTISLNPSVQGQTANDSPGSVLNSHKKVPKLFWMGISPEMGIHTKIREAPAAGVELQPSANNSLTVLLCCPSGHTGLLQALENTRGRRQRKLKGAWCDSKNNTLSSFLIETEVEELTESMGTNLSENQPLVVLPMSLISQLKVTSPTSSMELLFTTVSPSLPQGDGRGKKIPDTYGRISQTEFDLCSPDFAFLKTSRDTLPLDCATFCSTWPEWVIDRRGAYLARANVERLTRENEFLSWQNQDSEQSRNGEGEVCAESNPCSTPNTQDSKGAGSKTTREEGKQMQLQYAVRFGPLVPEKDNSSGNPQESSEAWSTPRSGATDNSRPNNKGGIPLGDQVRRSEWPTAKARDWKDTMGCSLDAVNPDGSHRDRRDRLVGAVAAEMSGPPAPENHSTTGSRQELSNWKTPHGFCGVTEDGRQGGGGEFAKQVKQVEKWLTPTTTDIERTPEGVEKRIAYRASIGRQYVEGCLTEQGKNEEGEGKAGWPTPTTNDISSRGPNSKQVGLDNIFKKNPSWATPQSMDHIDVVRKPEERSAAANKGGCCNLREQVYNIPEDDGVNWSTPRVGGEEDAATRIARGKDLGLLGQCQTATWPTVASAGVSGGPVGLGGGAGNRAKMKRIMGKEVNSKLNPDWVCTLMGIPVGWVRPNGRNLDNADEKTRAREVLLNVRRAVETKGFQWEAGRFWCFLAKEILRSGVRLSGFTSTICWMVSFAQEGQETHAAEMREVFWNNISGSTPQRLQPCEQFTRELDYAVCQLSHEIALERREEGMEETTSMQGGRVQGTTQGKGVLPETLPAMEEVWRSTLSWAAIQSARENAVGCGSRTDELRMLGNGVVPLTAGLAFDVLGSELVAYGGDKQ